MAVTKSITIDGKQVPFRASAAIPRIYRNKFHSDIFRDLQKLSDSIDASDEQASVLDIGSLEIFENIAWLMAKHADPAVPEIEDWLEQFDTFSIYQILPQLIELWGLNTEREVEAVKNSQAPSGK